MAYYGAIEFSLLRACWQTVFFPAVVCLLLGTAYYAFYDAGSFMSGMHQAFDTISEFYRQYPYVALGIHGLLFLKGLLYRPRIGNLPLQLLMIGLGLSGVWYLATKMGIQPQDVLSKSILPQVTAPDVYLPDTQEQVAIRQKALVVHPLKPNLLNQPRAPISPVAEFKPANDGSWTSSGYIASTGVVYVLNMDSAITAASYELSKFAKKPCVESTSTVEGETIVGCTAWVEDSYIGPMPLPRIQVFFTPKIPGKRIILGSNAFPHINIQRTPSDSFELSRR